MAPMRHGVHRPLEEEANRLIRESLKGKRSYAEKADILTRSKERLRHSREVLVPMADPSVRSGVYGRAINRTRPELNSRDGIYQPRQEIGGTLSGFVQEHGRFYE